jgi:hypothetical protein
MIIFIASNSIDITINEDQVKQPKLGACVVRTLLCYGYKPKVRPSMRVYVFARIRKRGGLARATRNYINIMGAFVGHWVWICAVMQ